MAERPEDGVMADKAEGQGGGTSFLPLSEEENEYIRKLKNIILLTTNPSVKLQLSMILKDAIL